jgi:hypothetical protein
MKFLLAILATVLAYIAACISIVSLNQAAFWQFFSRRIISYYNYHFFKTAMP